LKSLNLSFDRRLKGEEFQSIISEIRGLEIELKGLKLKEKVNAINSKAKREREFIQKILSLCPIDMDIFCNDMTLHKSKESKAPELYAMKASEEFKYMYFSIEFSKTLVINFNRFEFRTTKVEYINGGENIRHNWKDANEAIQAHNIPLKDIKLSEVMKHANKVQKQADKVKQETEKLDKLRRENNGYLFEYNGLLKQRSETYYTSEIVNL
jgi:hypothetical protein